MMKIKKVVKKIVFKTDAILCRIFLNWIVKRGKYTRAHISFDDVSLTAIDSKDSLIYELSRWQKELGLKAHLYLFYQQNKQKVLLDRLWNQISENDVVIGTDCPKTRIGTESTTTYRAENNCKRQYNVVKKSENKVFGQSGGFRG